MPKSNKKQTPEIKLEDLLEAGKPTPGEPKQDRMESIEQRLDALESKENLSKIALYNQVSAENDSRGETILSMDAELKSLKAKIKDALTEIDSRSYGEMTNKDALSVFKVLNKARGILDK